MAKTEVSPIKQRNNRSLNTKENKESTTNSLEFSIKNPKVIVCVRKKPTEGTQDIIEIQSNTISVHNNKISYALDHILFCHKFSFDKVYNERSTNLEIFENSIENMVEHTLNGGCSTVVAYGQTGTGKTYSLLSPNSGIIFQSLAHILKKKFKGSISFLEIYLGHVQDCLKNKNKLNIFEKNGCIFASDLTSIHFNTFEEASAIIEIGLSNRTTSRTDTNSYSSRSHAVLFIDCYNDNNNRIKDGPRKLASDSTFVLVDLAGSERGIDRKSCSKESVAEGAEINKSLLALKECIRGIELNSKFLPFRQSKLTQLLKNSFVGASKLLFLATISSNSINAEHSLNTLRYAIRIKEGMLNNPKADLNTEKIEKVPGLLQINEVKDDRLIGEIVTIEKLKRGNNINPKFVKSDYYEKKDTTNSVGQLCDKTPRQVKSSLHKEPIAVLRCQEKEGTDIPLSHDHSKTTTSPTATCAGECDENTKKHDNYNVRSNILPKIVNDSGKNTDGAKGNQLNKKISDKCIKVKSTSAEKDGSSIVLTSDEIKRLKDLSLHINEDCTDDVSVIQRLKIKEAVNEITRNTEILNDFNKLEEISQNLDLILSNLKNGQ